jgi:hypothetical protein
MAGEDGFLLYLIDEGLPEENGSAFKNFSRFL